jgi:hypothetical protein
MGETKLKYDLQLIDFSKNKAFDIPLDPSHTLSNSPFKCIE